IGLLARESRDDCAGTLEQCFHAPGRELPPIVGVRPEAAYFEISLEIQPGRGSSRHPEERIVDPFLADSPAHSGAIGKADLFGHRVHPDAAMPVVLTAGSRTSPRSEQ